MHVCLYSACLIRSLDLNLNPHLFDVCAVGEGVCMYALIRPV